MDQSGADAAHRRADSVEDPELQRDPPQVRIDGGDWKPITMIADDQPHDFELATGMPKGPYQVELYKRSETQNGVTQFRGFDFQGGQLLAPPPRKTRIDPLPAFNGSTPPVSFCEYSSSHHSQTLPCMSYNPQGFGSF